MDIAVLPFDVTDPTVLIEPWEAPSVTPPLDPDPRLRPTEDVFVIGYPYGLQSGIDLPLWIRGTIASEPAFYWRSKLGQELPLFLVDGRTREGQSGAPVIFFRPPNTLFLSPQQQLSYTKGMQSKLLGVYSGRTYAEGDTGSSDLGFCWRIGEVNTICREQVRATKLDQGGIGDDSEQVLFDHLGDDDLITLLANPDAALSAALVIRLALIPGGLPGRAEWVSDLSDDSETVRLSAKLRERLTGHHEKLSLWWENLDPDDRTCLVQHRDDELTSSYAEIVAAAAGYLGPHPAFADSTDFDALRIWAVARNDWKGIKTAAVIVSDDGRAWYVAPSGKEREVGNKPGNSGRLSQLEKLIARLEGRLTGPHPSYELAPPERWQHKTIHVDPR